METIRRRLAEASRLHRAGRAPERLPGKVTLEVEPGDRLIVLTPGGGGWGPLGTKRPRQRNDHVVDERGTRRIVLACSDYVSPSSFADANRRAVADRSPILFAWISNGRTTKSRWR